MPVVLVLGLMIKLQDRGPAFFFQDRLGRRGRRFRIIKLRTMRVNAQVDRGANIAEGPLTLIPNDPRVIPMGHWLRRHKLDELPQLLNVLTGQMSMVGPRPPIEEEVQQYTEWQKGRLFVPPGLTGLWQIDKQRKWRFNEMVELDLQYILNWSLLLDYSVMLRTIQVVLKGN
jgi:lipopolysaccharide/colanic/teichoic acid biosynthesis glycosyltransferase